MSPLGIRTLILSSADSDAVDGSLRNKCPIVAQTDAPSSCRIMKRKSVDGVIERQPKPAKRASSSLSIGTPFEQRVWALTKRCPIGQFLTYSTLAIAMQTSPRAVGNALRKNPYAPIVPCHRVLRVFSVMRIQKTRRSDLFFFEWKRDFLIGGYMGEVQGAEVERKIALLKAENLDFVMRGGKLVSIYALFWLLVSIWTQVLAETSPVAWDLIGSLHTNPLTLVECHHDSLRL